MMSLQRVKLEYYCAPRRHPTVTASVHNWRQLKGSIKENWGNLTDDQLDVIAGKCDQFPGAYQGHLESHYNPAILIILLGVRIGRNLLLSAEKSNQAADESEAP